MRTETTRRSGGRGPLVTTGAVVCAVLSTVTACSSSSAPSPRTPSASATVMDSLTYARTIYECLRDKGWDVTFDPYQGGIESSIPQAQMSKYQADDDACSSGLPTQPPLSAWTDQDWTKAYDAQVKAAECLTKLGVDEPPVPSRQAFIDSWLNSDAWIAYGAVGDVNESTLDSYLTKCPQPQ